MFPPFTPSGSTATLAVTNATGRVALAWSGQRTLRVKNAPESAARMFVKTGDITVTAATTDTPVDPGETIELSIADADTYIAAITAALTATLLATSGQGQSGATAGGPATVTVTPAGTQNVNLTQVGGAAVALGQAAMAASVPVAIASNQSAVPVTSTQSSTGITPVVSTVAESNHVLKASAGVLWQLTVATGASAGYAMVFNATSAPADGAVTPIECLPVPANSAVSLSFTGGPPEAYSVGITAVFSTTGPFTKTASATAFFSGKIQ